ncbi:hypothetical protein [Methylobacterium sp. NFXW15]|uniref:hypothetical protein n=1 Tax=Methylobacterium sp. NFXW15 TaxID=2819512 RepID=UPI003CF8E010
MLALIASRVPNPAQEAADRDPGLLTLVFALVRAVRRESAGAVARHCELLSRAGGPIPL